MRQKIALWKARVDVHPNRHVFDPKDYHRSVAGNAAIEACRSVTTEHRREDLIDP